MSIPAGPLVLDVGGTALDDADRRRLAHRATGGVILFARNFSSPAQLGTLTAEIRALRPELLICVDHEGGRVQRFRDGFTAVPPMRALGRRWEESREAALEDARAVGRVIGHELRRHDIDFSFTPVLDLDYGASSVIGDRAFHGSAQAVGALAAALIGGLSDAGVGAVGKHFPGHGYAVADSHVEVPYDDRTLDQIMTLDVAPYRDAIAAGLRGVMPAHVIYTQVDPEPAGYSALWLRNILRDQLGFDGLVFSDDLSMAGASVAGGVAGRAHAALAAGCDMVLLCNDPEGQDVLLDALGDAPAVSSRRCALMRAQDTRLTELAYRDACSRVRSLG